MFAEVIHDAGFPPGTLNVVHGRGDVGSALVTNPDVASVVFTGSTKTGEQVARDAALKNRVLELGGNGPQIVLADANLEKAADAAIVGCFYLAGQCCTAAERILVHESVKDEFVAKLVERTKVLRVGIRSTRRRTWGRSAPTRCSPGRSSTSRTPLQRARGSSTGAGTRAASTSPPSSMA